MTQQRTDALGTAFLGALLCALGVGAYFALEWAAQVGGTIAGPALGVLLFVLLGSTGVALMFIIPGSALMLSAILHKRADAGPIALTSALALSAFLIGRWLIGHGFLLVGGAAVGVGGLVFSAMLKPQRLGEGFLAIFWASWTGYGAFAMLRAGRYFSFAIVLFAFAFGLMMVRSLFTRNAPQTKTASNSVIEGEVTATRDEPSEPIKPS